MQSREGLYISADGARLKANHRNSHLLFTTLFFHAKKYSKIKCFNHTFQNARFQYSRNTWCVVKPFMIDLRNRDSKSFSQKVWKCELIRNYDGWIEDLRKSQDNTTRNKERVIFFFDYPCGEMAYMIVFFKLSFAART